MKKMTEQEIRLEYAMIAAIISDNYMKPLYELCGEGYVACLDIIAKTTHTIFHDLVYPEGMQPNWEEYLEEVGGCCWDDFIIALSGKLLAEQFPGIKIEN